MRAHASIYGLCVQVTRVIYLGLPSHPSHELAKRLLGNRYSGMLSFEIQGSLEDGIKVVEVSSLWSFDTQRKNACDCVKM